MENYDGKIIKNPDTNLYECKYWRPAVAVDAVLFVYDSLHNDNESEVIVGNNDKALQILLIRRGLDPFAGQWALPGGFMTENDFNAEEAIKRELYEETNVETDRKVKIGPLVQVDVFSNRDRDERDHIITIPFYALTLNKKVEINIKGGSDAIEARWFPVKNLPKLAFDHKEIIECALKKLQQRVYVDDIARHLMNDKFTITELYNLYFAILYPTYDDMSEEEKSKVMGKFNRANFVKKIESLGYFVRCKKEDGADDNEFEKRMNTSYRQPMLYKFDKEEYERVVAEGTHMTFNFRRKKEKKESRTLQNEDD